MSLLFSTIFRSVCRSTHHRLALDALRHLRMAEAERWSDLFLAHYAAYLEGSKAPDDRFKDFRNHVLHVADNNWGGAIGETRRWYGRTVDALRRHEWHEAVYSAGVTSHYFSDPFMPLHTAQSEEETKVHRALEWSVAKSYGELQQIIEGELGGYPQLEAPPREDWLEKMVLAGAQLAHEHYQALLDHYDLTRGLREPTSGMDHECKERVAECLGHAVVGFARVLERAIQEAEVEPPAVDTTLLGFAVGLGAPLRWVLHYVSDLNERLTIEAIHDEVQRLGKVIKNLPEDDREIRRLHAEEVLNLPLHQLDQRPTKLTGTLYGQGKENRHYPNRLIAGPPDTGMQRASLSWQDARRRASGQSGTAVTRGAGVLPAQKLPSTSTTYPPAHRRIAPTQATSSPTPKLKFHLHPGSPVVDAPTIGSKTAGKLERAGIMTVAELLAADADALAAKLGQRHIGADDVRQWQHEAALVCRVPELRGHDAQLLVAADVKSPEALAAEAPEDLLTKMQVVAQSAVGARILRNQPPPDLAEVTRWIENARSYRPLPVAA